MQQKYFFADTNIKWVISDEHIDLSQHKEEDDTEVIPEVSFTSFL